MWDLDSPIIPKFYHSARPKNCVEFLKLRLRNTMTIHPEVVKFLTQVENLAKFNIYPQYSL